MIAFHGKPEIKEFYLNRVQQHRLADDLIHGQYWDNGRGCSVGCTIHGSNHAAYETELGIPRMLARLEDGMFEALAAPEDRRWPEQFLAAIPVGADLALIWPQFTCALLQDPPYGVLHWVHETHYRQQREAIEQVLLVYTQWVQTGQKPPAPAAYAAYAAATAAAATATATAYAMATTATAAAYATAAATAAAYVAAYAADATTATAAAYAATYAADAAAVAAAATTAEAAYAAAVTADADAADAAVTAAVTAGAAAEAAYAAQHQKARCWQAHTLLRVLRDAPVPAVQGATTSPYRQPLPMPEATNGTGADLMEGPYP